MRLYRPIALNELRLIYQSGMKNWPPRLPEQPIFYPVLECCYAQQIARDWNVKSDSYAGFVMKFEINDAYINKFEKHIVGSSQHVELWIPAEELNEFNNNIIGEIEIIDAYFGEEFNKVWGELALKMDGFEGLINYCRKKVTHTWKKGDEKR